MPPAPADLPGALGRVHVAGLAADERLVDFDLAARACSNVPVCIASRMRCSMNHADFCVTPSARPSSCELMPFFELAMSQTAGSHLSSPSGESSKIVPTLTRDCFLHALALPQTAPSPMSDLGGPARRAARAGPRGGPGPDLPHRAAGGRGGAPVRRPGGAPRVPGAAGHRPPRHRAGGPDPRAPGRPGDPVPPSTQSDLRLDSYLDVHGDRLTPEIRLDLVRQLAEAVRYAHSRSLYHRALAARSVYVSAKQDGVAPGAAGHRLADRGPGLRHRRSARRSASPRSAGEHVADAAEVYLAPESDPPYPDPVDLDVFGLGASPT